MKITHEHLDAAMRKVSDSGSYSVLDVFNAAQDMANAEIPTEAYITAEEARRLGDEMTTEKNREAFEAWWDTPGQYTRSAGGGDYEKSFAYAAWQASRKKALDEVRVLTPAMHDELNERLTDHWYGCAQHVWELVLDADKPKAAK